MINQFRRRVSILVFCVLILVTVGIVFSIDLMNRHNIAEQAQQTLETLANNRGLRPPFRGLEGSGNDGRPDKVTIPAGERKSPPDSTDTLASLSNYYVIRLGEDETVLSWSSDREDLYSDEEVEALTSAALASGKETGRYGTQFYRLADLPEGKTLIVLDERLDMMSADRVLRVTALIAAIACLILCTAAWFLIRRMALPVQQAFDRQRQFVWDASHELKTPLAVIGANADVLTGEIGENDHLQYIRSEVRRTNTLIGDLLTLARMDRGTQTAEKKEIDLSKTLLEVALPFESTAFEAGKTFDIDIPDHITCIGDAAMLQQLTVILLSNALKYSDEHGRIRISAGQRGKTKEIAVMNTGPGIAPEDLGRIFDRFYRADTSHNREVEGYGLGLSIARNIAEAHHGRIAVKSEQGRETVFTVTLP